MAFHLKDDLEAKIRASFFILLQSCLELSGHDFPYFPELRAGVLRAAQDLNAPDEPPSPDHLPAAIRKLYALRGHAAMSHEWREYSNLRQRMTETTFPIPMAEQLFAAHIEHMVQKNQGKTIDAHELSAGLAYIPLRMTTARYYDYIADAFALQPPDGPAEDYALLFDPRGCVGDDGWQREIKAELDALWEMEEPTPESANSVEDALGELKAIQDRLVAIAGYFSTLFDGLCAAGIARRAGEFGIDLLDDPETRALYEAFLRAPETRGEDFDAKLDAAAHRVTKNISHEEQGESAAGDALYPAWLSVHTAYYATVFDDYTPLSDANASAPEDMGAFLAELRGRMDEAVKGLDGKRKRFLRAQFFRALPYPYDIEAYRDYFLAAYEGTDDLSRRLMCLFFAPINTGEA